MARPLPPEVRGYELLPHLLQPLNFLLAARAKYGDVYMLRLGPKTVLVFNHPRHVHQLYYAHSQRYRKQGDLQTPLRAVLKESLVTSDDALWLTQRRQLQPSFQTQVIRELTATMVHTGQEVLATWDRQAARDNPPPFALFRALDQLALRLTARVLLGADPDEAKALSLINALAATHDYFNVGLGIALTQAPPGWPIPGRGAYQRQLRQIETLILSLLARSTRTPNLLARFAAQHPTAPALDALAVTLFISGYETTAALLKWLFYLLASHPPVLSQVQTEVAEVLGQRAPQFADLPSLPYTHQVIQETLRLYPPGWRLTRTALEEDEVDGFRVPARATTMIATYALHRHPALWPNPHRFEPHRFAPDAPRPTKFAWIPFGAGPRQCIGEDLALTEVQLLLVLFIQKYHFSSEVSRPFPRVRLATTLSPAEDLIVRLRPRPPA